MSRKKTKNTGLGLGLEALIKSKTREKVENEAPSSPKKLEKEDKEISPGPDESNLKMVASEVKKNPRITLWSARSAAVLRYLKKTRPEFSISKEASKLIEDAVQEKYPEIWEMFSNIK